MICVLTPVHILLEMLVTVEGHPHFLFSRNRLLVQTVLVDRLRDNGRQVLSSASSHPTLFEKAIPPLFSQTGCNASVSAFMRRKQELAEEFLEKDFPNTAMSSLSLKRV